MKIFSVFNAQEVLEIKKIIELGIWKNGKDSALGAAKYIKENKQISAGDPIFSQIMPFLQKAHSDKTVRTYTFLKELIDPRISLYELNDHYDWHIDVSLLANRRTDLSYTIFLSDKDDYEGGELTFKSSNHIYTVKGSAGSMVVYPSGLLHKVSEVTSGKRLVIVGWINSNVKLEEHRERLFDLAVENTRIGKIIGDDEMKKLNQLYHCLIRDFSQ